MVSSFEEVDINKILRTSTRPLVGDEIRLRNKPGFNIPNIHHEAVLPALIKVNSGGRRNQIDTRRWVAELYNDVGFEEVGRFQTH